MRMGHKRFFVRYENDKMICGDFDHFGGNASTIKSAKAIISNIKRDDVNNPRNFRVYDSDGEIDERTNFVPCIYSE